MTIRRDRTHCEAPALAMGQKQRDRHDPGRGERSGLKWAHIAMRRGWTGSRAGFLTVLSRVRFPTPPPHSMAL